jgi:hypothetical protein
VDAKQKIHLIKSREVMCLMSMLFLGAGASNSFGIGQLRDFTPKVDDILDSIGYSDLRKHIHGQQGFGIFRR